MQEADFTKGAAFLDGRYTPIGEARIPITDWGFLHSDATYDVVTVWDGAFFRLDAHLERFMRSCECWRLDPGLTPGEIAGVLAQCVRLSRIRSAYVEMICTRGQPPAGSRDPRLAANRFCAFAIPYVWLASAEAREKGLHVVISDVRRIPPSSVNPKVKNYHWNDLTMGLFGALDGGADSALLVDSEGNVAEGPGFNAFCVSHGALVTPDRGVLEGVSRRTVIEMAHSLGLEVQQRPTPADELRGAEEVFLTASAGGVVPVTQVDRRRIGDGVPGPVTRQLIETYWAWHRDPAYSLAVDYSL